MKKFLWTLVVLVVVGYFVNFNLEKEAAREAEKAAAANKATKIEAAVSQMVSRTEAIDDWILQLDKIEKYRLGPVFTIDLERLWVQPRPILFRGVMKDISTVDPSRYTVELVEPGFFLRPKGLQLSLISSKGLIDSFLEKHSIQSRKGDWRGIVENVAVVASIHSVRARTIQHCECSEYEDELYGYVEAEEVKIGDGELIDIVYTGDVQ